MKTIVSIISWVSCILIIGVISVFSLFCGSYAAGYVGDLFGICGAWPACLVLTPVMFIVALCVCMFIMSGLKKFEC